MRRVLWMMRASEWRSPPRARFLLPKTTPVFFILFLNLLPSLSSSSSPSESATVNKFALVIGSLPFSFLV